MTRLLLLSVAGACAAGIGLGGAQALRTRAALLLALRTALSQMTDAMLLASMPLPALLCGLGTGGHGARADVGRVMARAGELLEASPDLRFHAAFLAAAGEQRAGPLRALRAGDLEALSPWLELIGEGGMDQQRRALEGAAATAERLEREASARLPEQTRLCRTLGLAAGAALVLLLW
ncbi:MAG TPA: hypothetical protein IAB73_05265 [Candidatus Onthenecus intestinigallinarum]|uniref:Stage III sporulation protein AB n=1 Tax=Candidatus Onthenecus intestinigallinarum TaxID=2840875 RepID=A0A9D1CQ77_9FIRM|nr:hypothetical protein [Candidatus Onthenecus intestinigallinarum]